MILENDVVVDTHSYIIKPRDWVIPEEVVAIHGITQEKAASEGVDLGYALDRFMYEPYDVMLAHNLEFDENVVVQAIHWDLGRKNFHNFPQPKRCTMRASEDICKLPGKFRGYKPPKLSELYTHVFGTPPIQQNLHNSLYDVEILVKILQTSQELRERLGLLLPRSLQDNAAQAKSNILRI